MVIIMKILVWIFFLTLIFFRVNIFGNIAHYSCIFYIIIVYIIILIVQQNYFQIYVFFLYSPRGVYYFFVTI